MSIIENKTPYTDISPHGIPQIVKNTSNRVQQKERHTSIHRSNSCGVLIRYLLSNTEKHLRILPQLLLK